MIFYIIYDIFIIMGFFKKKIDKTTKRIRGHILVSVLHSFAMLFLTLFLLNQRLIYGDEMTLIQITSAFKKLVLKIDTKPARDELLFVNVAYDPVLVEKLDDDGIPVGEQPITDRKKLARFFEILNKKPDNYKFVICDIFFADPSPDDSLLSAQITKMKNIIIPFHENDDGSYELPIFDVENGFADYDVMSDSFLKFRLLYKDTIKSLPLRMYEMTHNRFLKKFGFLYFMGGKPSFNTMVLDFKVRYYDILEDVSPDPYPFVHLGELLSLNENIIQETVKGKIIMLGDFKERDLHQTIFGSMPGTIILLNAYLTLVNRDNIIDYFFILYLLICYFLISLDLFSPHVKTERRYIAAITKYKIGNFIVKYVGFVVYLAVISLISYFIFNIHINILVIALYLKIVEYVIAYYRKKKHIVQHDIQEEQEITDEEEITEKEEEIINETENKNIS